MPWLSTIPQCAASNVCGPSALVCTRKTMGRYFNGFCARITRVWRLRCKMGGGESAFKDATLYSLPNGYRRLGISRVVFTRSSTPSRTPTDYCFRPRPKVCVNFLATGVQSVGDWSKNVNSVSPTDRWTDRTNECQYGAVSPGVCEPPPW